MTVQHDFHFNLYSKRRTPNHEQTIHQRLSHVLLLAKAAEK